METEEEILKTLKEKWQYGEVKQFLLEHYQNALVRVSTGFTSDEPFVGVSRFIEDKTLPPSRQYVVSRSGIFYIKESADPVHLDYGDVMERRHTLDVNLGKKRIYLNRGSEKEEILTLSRLNLRKEHNRQMLTGDLNIIEEALRKEKGKPPNKKINEQELIDLTKPLS